jgi:hypothetical protein
LIDFIIRTRFFQLNLRVLICLIAYLAVRVECLHFSTACMGNKLQTFTRAYIIKTRFIQLNLRMLICSIYSRPLTHMPKILADRESVLELEIQCPSSSSQLNSSKPLDLRDLLLLPPSSLLDNHPPLMIWSEVQTNSQSLVNWFVY